MMPEQWSIYIHSKTGNEYVVLSIGRHTETGEDIVIYTRVDNPKDIWCRPARMWDEIIQLPNGTSVPRFHLKPNGNPS